MYFSFKGRDVKFSLQIQQKNVILLEDLIRKTKIKSGLASPLFYMKQMFILSGGIHVKKRNL